MIMLGLQGRSQHGARGQLPPSPDFSSAPPDRLCPDHGRSLAMGQLPLKITSIPKSLTSSILIFIKIACKYSYSSSRLILL